jgi:hypothetical protein
MSRPVDIGELETVARWLTRLGDTLDRAVSGIADAIADVQAEQRQQRDELEALSNRIESVARVVSSRTDYLA